MKIEVSTDTRVASIPINTDDVIAAVETGLARFRDRLTRVEVHLSDVNGPRGGVDHRCLLEARPEGLQPVAVSHEAGSKPEALRGAVDKMHRMLTSTFDKLHDRKGGTSASGQPT